MNNEAFYLADTIDVMEEILASGGEFRLYPKGVSMLPLIKQERDSVVLSRKSEPTSYRRHELVFYRRTNGQFVLHRIMKTEADGTYTMCGDNQTSMERQIRPEQILGYVKTLYRKDREVKFRSLSYRLYVCLWSNMYIRRGCFFIRRVFRKLFR